MSSLDEKVKLIILGLPDSKGGIADYDMEGGLIQIRQAFADEGYINTKSVTFEGFIVENLMVGQNWFNKFEKEIFKVPHDLYRLEEVLLVAKRAAGLKTIDEEN